MKQVLLSFIFTLLALNIHAQAQYTYQQLGDKYVVSVNNHEEVVKVLTDFCKDMNIQAGSIIGIGAINEATLRFFNPQTKKYVDKTFNEQMEISNLTGNVSTMNGKTYVHIHATLGRSDYSALAGHLLSAKLNGAGEFVVEKFDGKIERYFDKGTGLNMYLFESK
ncbi:PPC domain-containing DNA-binding protein [uncultured Bacteroides sp.]|uniref:PPC domain-containing DNA-binding protein n=1 Tax=uncultured Bacteroides sp. TaxID=162156 RepID=UPI0026041DC7|nr:PPC domain-containing DNA-binding protein [uncultured Bacteroides sp.]